MTGIHRTAGIGIATVRTSIELTVLAAGVALGGHAGWATLAFAALVGYSLAGTFRLMTALFPERSREFVGAPAPEQLG
jgi:uncharacterized membrane protein YczE